MQNDRPPTWPPLRCRRTRAEACAGRGYALALGARAVTQPWRTWRPPGLAVGAGVAAPGLGPEGVVVLVVVVGAAVVVVLGAAVVVVVVPSGLTRLLLGIVVVVVEEVVVVAGATVVVVALGLAGEPGGAGADGPGALGAAAGVGVVMTAVVQAPAFCNVSTSATRRTSAWLSLPLSWVKIVSSCCSVFWTAFRWDNATFTAAVAAWVSVRRSEATNVAY